MEDSSKILENLQQFGYGEGLVGDYQDVTQEGFNSGFTSSYSQSKEAFYKAGYGWAKKSHGSEAPTSQFLAKDGGLPTNELSSLTIDGDGVSSGSHDLSSSLPLDTEKTIKVKCNHPNLEFSHCVHLDILTGTILK